MVQQQQQPKHMRLGLVVLLLGAGSGAFANQWLKDNNYGHLRWPLIIGTLSIALVVWLLPKRRKKQ